MESTQQDLPAGETASVNSKHADSSVTEDHTSEPSPNLLDKIGGLDSSDDDDVEQQPDEEEEYDPPFDSNWQAAFINHTTIFDSRPRYHHPRKTAIEIRDLREAWEAERRMILQTHRALLAANENGTYVGMGLVKSCMRYAADSRDVWESRVMDRLTEEMVERQEVTRRRRARQAGAMARRAARLAEEREVARVVWRWELPFWDGYGEEDGDEQA